MLSFQCLPLSAVVASVNLLAGAASVRYIYTSLTLHGLSIGGGLAVTSSGSYRFNAVREALGFGNLF